MSLDQGALETSKLLQPTVSRPTLNVLLGSNSSRRPPLYTIPSSNSLRSLRSLNDPLITERLSDEMDFPLTKINTFYYISYYIPILKWLPEYRFRELIVGDFVAGLSIASFQIPLVMSFATSLGHLPPITGLYSMIVGSSVYSILGSVPVLIVGPAPSSSLLFGQTIQNYPQNGKGDFSPTELATVMTATVLGLLLGAGIFRLGFLSSILSRSLLKGFLGAMGLMMIIGQMSSEFGLEDHIPKQLSPSGQLWWILSNTDKIHHLSFTISCITLAVVMAIRLVKSNLIGRYKQVVYFPELLLMVILATFLSEKYDWYEKGVGIVGDLKSSSVVTDAPSVVIEQTIYNPFEYVKLIVMKKTFSTAFLCAVLGYFDSVIAMKNLGARFNYNISFNRELIALGTVNFVASVVGGLPAFGALGRSKINVTAGATSPMSGIIMAAVTIFAIAYLLPFLYYLPKCVLALSTTIIGITVLEEVPTDLEFFWRIGGYDEILIFVLVFLTTFFWSAEAGVLLGVGMAVVRIIKSLSRSRIHILGRIPNSAIFRNVDELIEENFASIHTQPSAVGGIPSSDALSSLIAEMEEIEGVLIIKIPEPLNFANVGDLQNRLSRIEKYGSLLTHPSQPHTRDISRLKFIIFDCKGMSSVDSLAAQILHEIVKRYIDTRIAVCFSRVPIDIRPVLGKLGLTKLVNDEFRDRESPLGNLVGMGNGFFKSIDDALKVLERIQEV